MTQENLIERLMAENEEFRRLRSEHQEYERELDALKLSTSLSADQHWRMSELKKLKLMAKDRMESIMRSSRWMSFRSMRCCPLGHAGKATAGFAKPESIRSPQARANALTETAEAMLRASPRSPRLRG